MVCDAVEGAENSKIKYAWHGLPEASWWAEDGRAVIYHDGVELWIASAGATIAQEQIVRLRGSRGHQSLLAQVIGNGARRICWWIFNLGPQLAVWQAEGQTLRIEGMILCAP